MAELVDINDIPLSPVYQEWKPLLDSLPEGKALKYDHIHRLDVRSIESLVSASKEWSSKEFSFKLHLRTILKGDTCDVYLWKERKEG